MNLAIKTVQVVINGVTTSLTYNATTKKYEATITAPVKSSYNQSGHYYNVQVKATDEAGNIASADAAHASLGTSLRLSVKEKVAPVSAFVSPSSGALLRAVRPTITWKVTDDDSGVNPNTIAITLDNGSKITSGITKTAITGGYQCAYTPTSDLAQGVHTAKVDATDYDGNPAVQKSLTFTCDTINPVLAISTPANGLVTKTVACTVSGTATDATTAPCSVTVKLNSGAAQSVPVADSGAYTKALSLVEGSNTITVTATDRAGNTTSQTVTVKLDTKAPVFKTVTITPNPVDAGKTFIVSVDATDD